MVVQYVPLLSQAPTGEWLSVGCSAAAPQSLYPVFPNGELWVRQAVTAAIIQERP